MLAEWKHVPVTGDAASPQLCRRFSRRRSQGPIRRQNPQKTVAARLSALAPHIQSSSWMVDKVA